MDRGNMASRWVMAAAVVAMAGGCEERGAAPKAVAPVGTPAPVALAAPVVIANVRDFQVQLKDVTVTSRRVFGTSTDSYSRTPSGASVQVTMVLQDLVGSRVYRVREGAVVRSVVDGSGAELLKNGDEPVKSMGGSRSEFTITTEQRSSVPSSYQATIPVGAIPTVVRRIAGEFKVEMVNGDLDKIVALPEIEQPVEVAPGITVVLKLLEADPPPTTGTVNTNGPWMGRASVEVRTENGTAERPAAVAQSVELLDASGIVLATLVRKEESTVGKTTRRRYTIEPGYSGSRSERGGAGKKPASLRLRVLTEIETVTLPFEFGPVDMSGGEGTR